MSGDPSSALAVAAARIAELEADLAAAHNALVETETTVAAERQRTTAAEDALAKATSDAAAANDQRNRELAQANGALVAAEAAKAKAQSDYFAISAKFDRMFGEPVQPGIVKVTKFRTEQDNAEHASLEMAQRRLAALRLGLTDQEAEKIMSHLASDPGALDALKVAAA